MLTDAAVRAAKCEDKTYRLHDDRGMYLEVTAAGGKYWRLKYRLAGRERRFAIGVYPRVGLQQARALRDKARDLIAQGIDPCQHARQARIEATIAAANSFEAVAREWWGKVSAGWEPISAQRVLRRLERDLFPWLGSRPIGRIEAPELLDALLRVERRGHNSTAHRLRQYCGRIFRYAITTSRAKRDPAADLRGDALAPVVERHHAAITDPAAVARLLSDLDAYQGHFHVRTALLLAPLTFVRPGNLRRARWSEINFIAAEWRIPFQRMKMREQFVVPLSRQALDLLRGLHPLTGAGEFLFPGVRDRKRPMSENTVNAALRRLGYGQDDMTGHGFRTMASTLLNEQGYPPDIIELQLAHEERNKVRAAYNRAQRLAERRQMMQAWADYLDELRAGRVSVAAAVA